MRHHALQPLLAVRTVLHTIALQHSFAVACPFGMTQGSSGQSRAFGFRFLLESRQSLSMMSRTILLVQAGILGGVGEY